MRVPTFRSATAQAATAAPAHAAPVKNIVLDHGAFISGAIITEAGNDDHVKLAGLHRCACAQCR